MSFENLANCIGCGCDDWHACVGDGGQPCSWLRVDYDEGLGVCSECPDHVERFDNGDRECAVPVDVDNHHKSGAA